MPRDVEGDGLWPSLITIALIGCILSWMAWEVLLAIDRQAELQEQETCLIKNEEGTAFLAINSERCRDEQRAK